MQQSSATQSAPSVVMAAPADGAGEAVPLEIFPPGFDLSRFIIFEPSTGEWVSGAGYTRIEPTLAIVRPNGPQPMDGGGGAVVSSGFYRVVRVGPHIVGITNGMALSGVCQIPVEVGYPDGQLVTLSLTEDDSPVNEEAIHGAPFELPVPLVTLDTTRMANGVHNIAAFARWENPNGTNEDGSSYFEADCPPISIVVSNEISYPNWMPGFGQLGNSLLISAQSAHANVNFLIDIYGANAGYIGTFSGYTPDGSIYGWWNLVGPPPNYINYTNEPWFQFKISTPYVDPATPKSYKITDPWPDPGDWVIVAQHAFDSMTDAETLYEEIDGFIGLAQASGLTVRPPPQDGHAYPIHFKDPVYSPGDWTAFRQALYHSYSRNLVYFGHGGPNGFGLNQTSTNSSIVASEIQTNLHTVPLNQTNRHAYRLVIIDGCSTAAGSLPESFGILHKEDVQGIDYVNASLRPSAFAGWSADKWVGFLNGSAINYGHVNFIIHIQQELANGNGIRGAIDAAGRYPDVSFVNTSQMKVFGLWGLTFWSYNN